METIRRNTTEAEQVALQDYLAEKKKAADPTTKWNRLFIWTLALLSVGTFVWFTQIPHTGFWLSLILFIAFNIISLVQDLVKLGKEDKSEEQVLVWDIGRQEIETIPLHIRRLATWEDISLHINLHLLELVEGGCMWLYEGGISVFEQEGLWPSSQVEIYKEKHVQRAISKLKCHGQPIQPIILDNSYFDPMYEMEEEPEDLQRIDKDFDQLLEEIRTGGIQST
ncbi:MAG: hypothetical protein AAFY71_04240 [Bacteroidota bacterium]